MNKEGICAILKGEVKKFGTSAHINCSRKYLGKEVIIFIMENK